MSERPPCSCGHDFTDHKIGGPPWDTVATCVGDEECDCNEYVEDANAARKEERE